MKVGVISDTHGRLESKVLELFEGVDRILHAGDIGDPDVLADLAAVAPVTAVLGNVDGFPLAETIRPVEIVELEGFRFLLVHQIGRPEDPLPEVRRLIREHRPDVVVSGHTHLPHDATVGGIRYLNPGGSGPRRFGKPRTVATMTLSAGRLEVEFRELDGERA